MNYPEFDASWFDYRAANEALSHGHYNKASKILRNAFADSQAAGTIDPQLLDSADTLAERYIDEGNYVHAASLYRMILDVKTKVHGDDHPDVRETRRRLALALWQTGGLSPKLLAANQQ